MSILDFKETEGEFRFDREGIKSPPLRKYGFRPVSDLIRSKEASPRSLKRMVVERQELGVGFRRTALPLAKTEVSSTGELSSDIPSVCKAPHYHEIAGTAHELAHQDLFEAAANRSCTVDDIKALPGEAGVIAEAYVLEQEQAYIDQVPRPLRGNYRQRKRELKGAVERLRLSLPEGVQEALPRRLTATSWIDTFTSAPSAQTSRRRGRGRRRRLR